MHRRTYKQYIFRSYNIHIQCGVLTKILSHDSAKNKTETDEGFKFFTFIGRWHNGSEGFNGGGGGGWRREELPSWGQTGISIQAGCSGSILRKGIPVSSGLVVEGEFPVSVLDTGI